MSDIPTDYQQQALDVVADYAAGATVRQVQDRLERPSAGSPRYTRDEVRSLLEALLEKGYVSKRRKRLRTLYSLVPGT